MVWTTERRICYLVKLTNESARRHICRLGVEDGQTNSLQTLLSEFACPSKFLSRSVMDTGRQT